MSEQAATLHSAFILAFERSATQALKLVTATGSIAGGAAPPNGPVAGAVCTFASGTLVAPKLDFLSYYRPPTYRLERLGLPVFVTSKETKWMNVFVSTLASLIDTAWSDWFLQWSGITQSFGGVAGWIPSAPPAPGPWLGGTVAPALLDGSGASASLLMKNLPDSFVSKLRSTSVTVDIDGSDAVTVRMIENEHSESFAKAIAGGLSDTFLNSMKQLQLFDKSKTGASGIAAPGGVVTGSVACTLDVQ